MSEVSPKKPVAKYRAAAAELAILSEIPTQTVIAKVDPRDRYKYDVASEVLFNEITGNFPEGSFGGKGVKSGFLVSFRLAYWGIKAYKANALEQGVEPSIPELGQILHGSYESAVTPFSSTTQAKNEVLENAFGLDAYLAPIYEQLPFRIVGSDDSRVLALSEYTLAKATESKLYSADEEFEHVGAGRCPASGRMLRKVWSETIQTCVNSEMLFPYDLVNA